MKITSSNGKSNKIHISVDGEYALTVDADYWYSCGVRDGDELNDEELTAFKEAVSSRCAYNKALNLLSYRDYCKKELVNKLVMKGVGREYAFSAVERIADLGYIDDERYANMLAGELFERKGMSPQKIKYELVLRGVSSEIAENAASGIDKNPVLRIIELLNTKYRRYLSDENGVKKTYAALVRLGYRRSEIARAFREAKIDAEPED